MSYSDDTTASIPDLSPIRRLPTLELADVVYLPFRLPPSTLERERARVARGGWTSITVSETYEKIGLPYRYEFWGYRDHR